MHANGFPVLIITFMIGIVLAFRLLQSYFLCCSSLLTMLLLHFIVGACLYDTVLVCLVF